MKTPEPRARACPSQTDLAAFSVGKLDDARTLEVTIHLQGCPQCVGFLAAHHDLSESVVGLIRAETEAVIERSELPQLHCNLRARQRGQVRPEKVKAEVALRPFPRRFGPYELGEFMGQGGMGSVYAGRHIRLKRPVVIKFLSPSRLGDAEAIERFHHEMELMGKFADPHIILAHDAGEEQGHHYLVMEHVEGVDSRRLLLEGGPLPVREACELARQAASGLATAHRLGVVHRDVKPSNLLASVTGQVKVLDLGLASLASADSTGDRSGTADYMAPEQWAGDPVDARTDIYGLGCTLFKLLTGRTPFSSEGGGASERLQAHLAAAPPDVRTLRPDAPEGLARLLEKMLTKAPDDRVATMQEVVGALAPFAAGAKLEELVRGRRAAGTNTERDPQRSTSVAERRTPLRKLVGSGRRRRLWGPLLVAVFGALALGGWLTIPRLFGSPLRRIDLLERPRTLIVHHGVTAPTFEPLEGRSGAFQAKSTDLGVWHTGLSPNEGPYALHLEFSADDWLTWTSPAFAMAPIENNGIQDLSWRMQCLSFTPKQDRDEGSLLVLQWCEIDLGESRNSRSRGVSFESLPRPDPKARHTVDLIVSDAGLLRVYFDGRHLKQLTVPGTKPVPIYIPGGVGLMCGHGTARFHEYVLLQGNERNLYAALHLQP